MKRYRQMIDELLNALSAIEASWRAEHSGAVIRLIVEEKRHDTHLLLVTDGATWKARVNDLRKLVEMQNMGLIARIYTHSMAEALRHDLSQLRRDHGL